MKRNTGLKIIAASLIVLVVVYFFLAIYSPGAGLYIRAEELPDEPDNFVDFSQNELEKYPYIQKAVSSPGNEIKVPYEDKDVMKNIGDFGKMLQSNDTMFLKVDNKYYNVHVEWAD